MRITAAVNIELCQRLCLPHWVSVIATNREPSTVALRRRQVTVRRTLVCALVYLLCQLYVPVLNTQICVTVIATTLSISTAKDKCLLQIHEESFCLVTSRISRTEMRLLHRSQMFHWSR